MKLKNFSVSKKMLLICTTLTIFVFSLFSYVFYQMGKEDEHIETLSWVVAGKKIVIDPGHGGIFPGKISKENILEKDVNLAVATQLKNILAESGAKVYMTREDDIDLVNPNEKGKLIRKLRTDLQARVKLAEENEADLFISIHCNSIPSPKWRGAQSFFDPQSEDSQELAKMIQKEITSQLKNTDRKAIARHDTFLFENLEMPAIIIEIGFLSNPEETKLLTQKEYQYRISYAIHTGIIKYLAQGVDK